LGLSTAETDRALNDLPAGMTIAFSPYAPNTASQIAKAAENNRETLIQIPLEAANYPEDDTGPKAISSRLSDKENKENTDWVLDRGEGTYGLINLAGGRLLADRKRLEPLLDMIKRRGFMFIENPDNPNSIVANIAQEMRLPYMRVDSQIDRIATETEIHGELIKLERIARQRGYAIGVAKPYPLTFNILKAWSESLGQSGIMLAPLATVWKNKRQYEQTLQTTEQPPASAE
jgi:polysaccharide deacetylase 2 family uncharacterized protein YibQ